MPLLAHLVRLTLGLVPLCEGGFRDPTWIAGHIHASFPFQACARGSHCSDMAHTQLHGSDAAVVKYANNYNSSRKTEIIFPDDVLYMPQTKNNAQSNMQTSS